MTRNNLLHQPVKDYKQPHSTSARQHEALVMAHAFIHPNQLEVARLFGVPYPGVLYSIMVTDLWSLQVGIWKAKEGLRL